MEGRHQSSVTFSQSLLKWIEKYTEIAFIIGGPVGLSADVIQQSQVQLALSAMTLPHELARIVLLEQIYRAATIINKQHYHK